MTGLLIAGVSLVTTMVGSEIALRGMKLQTGLPRVLAVWGGVYLAAMYWLIGDRSLSVIAFTVLWGGSFLTWFGVRSHVESSILLRMLVLLRGRPTTEAQLVTEYTSRYGYATRVEELCRGGLAQRQDDSVSVTPKGQSILRVVAKLR